MAINKLGFNKTDSYAAFAEETTFGTAITDGSNFSVYDIIGGATPTLVPAHFLDAEIRNRGKNMADIDGVFYTENGFFQEVALPEIVAPADVLAKMLYAAAQTVSEAASGAFAKTYTMDGTTDPDFSSNAGYFFTLLLKAPMASFSQKLTSCVMKSLTIKFAPDAQGGRCTISGTALTGQGYSGTSNPSGTNTHSSVAVPTFHNTVSTLSVDSLDCVPYSVSYTIENVFDFTGYASGNSDNYTLMSQKVTGQAIIKLDANSDVIRNKQGEFLGTFTHTVGSIGSAGYFNFVAGADVSLLKSVTEDRGGGTTVQKLVLDLDFMIDEDGAENPVFIVSDGVDQTW